MVKSKMQQVLIREATQSDKPKIVDLSNQWETENITYGYISCSAEMLDEHRIWVAISEDIVIGFLYGKEKTSKDMCVIPNDTPYFEVEDFYLLPEFRSMGIGTALFQHAERQLTDEGIKYILLSTATKDYAKIIKFYTENVGFTVWTATLFKQI